jgi:hypothetical protein
LGGAAVRNGAPLDRGAAVTRAALVAGLLLALAACGVAISGRVEVGEHVGTATASPCPGATE